MSMSAKRVFIIVLDSFGIGELPDAKDYGDLGSNTLSAITKSAKFSTPNLSQMGLFNIDGVEGLHANPSNPKPTASYARMSERSKGKDTTIGHWEIAGVISPSPLPTFPNGFPEQVISEFENQTARKTICNKPYSGTKVIEDFGQEHIETGKLIVYTSADSVFQIAAHEDIVPIEKLYEYCEIARNILTGENGVGRVIARPFIGETDSFKRTSNRHDFSLLPPSKTMLDFLVESDYDTIGVGKIYDIFAGKGIAQTHRTHNNKEGMEVSIKLLKQDFNGLCFINLVDFDMVFGHRNNVDGYANAMSEFDVQLAQFTHKMNADDILIITADHGCDPSTISTDHSREYVPLLVYGDSIKSGINLGTRKSFADIAKSVLDIFGIENDIEGESFYRKVNK